MNNPVKGAFGMLPEENLYSPAVYLCGRETNLITHFTDHIYVVVCDNTTTGNIN